MSHDILTRLSIGTVTVLSFFNAALYARELKGCDNETIKGVYGYTVTGVSPVPSAPGQLEQLLGVGIRTYDGQGNFTQVQSEKRASTPATLDVPGAGTYIVNSDCTGTHTTAMGIQARFVITRKGKEIHWIVVSSPVLTISGHAVRQ